MGAHVEFTSEWRMPEQLTEHRIDSPISKYANVTLPHLDGRKERNTTRTIKWRKFVPRVTKSTFRRMSSFHADENCTSIISISQEREIRKFIRKWSIAERLRVAPATSNGKITLHNHSRTYDGAGAIQVRINVDPTFHYYASYIFMRRFYLVSH